MVLQMETNFGLALTEKAELYLNAFIPSMTPISLQIFGKKVTVSWEVCQKLVKLYPHYIFVASYNFTIVEKVKLI